MRKQESVARTCGAWRSWKRAARTPGTHVRSWCPRSVTRRPRTEARTPGTHVSSWCPRFVTRRPRKCPGSGQGEARPPSLPAVLGIWPPLPLARAARCGSGQSKVWTILGSLHAAWVRLVQCPLPRPSGRVHHRRPRHLAVCPTGGRCPTRSSTAWTRRGGKGGPPNSILHRTARLCTPLHGTAGL